MVSAQQAAPNVRYREDCVAKLDWYFAMGSTLNFGHPFVPLHR